MPRENARGVTESRIGDSVIVRDASEVARGAIQPCRELLLGRSSTKSNPQSTLKRGKQHLRPLSAIMGVSMDKIAVRRKRSRRWTDAKQQRAEVEAGGAAVVRASRFLTRSHQYAPPDASNADFGSLLRLQLGTNSVITTGAVAS